MGASEDCKKMFDMMMEKGTAKYSHCYGVMERLIEIHNKLGLTPSEIMCNTALMHDIGYSKVIANPEDLGHAELGYRMLKDSRKVYSRAIKNHGSGKFDSESTEIERLATVILDYCDMTVDTSGKKCTIDERIVDIKKSYGDKDKVYLCVAANRNYFNRIGLGIKSAILDLNRLENEEE